MVGRVVHRAQREQGVAHFATLEVCFAAFDAVRDAGLGEHALEHTQTSVRAQQHGTVAPHGRPQTLTAAPIAGATDSPGRLLGHGFGE